MMEKMELSGTNQDGTAMTTTTTTTTASSRNNHTASKVLLDSSSSSSNSSSLPGDEKKNQNVVHHHAARPQSTVLVDKTMELASISSSSLTSPSSSSSAAAAAAMTGMTTTAATLTSTDNLNDDNDKSNIHIKTKPTSSSSSSSSTLPVTGLNDEINITELTQDLSNISLLHTLPSMTSSDSSSSSLYPQQNNNNNNNKQHHSLLLPSTPTTATTTTTTTADTITDDAPEAIKTLAAMLSSKKKKYTNIVVLTGAGISCNAGIPDFRTPGSGLYDNLQKYQLPHPTAVFDLEYYKTNPQPFVQLASELWPGTGKHSPTMTHSFIALLERKGLLLRNYTQNIDMLDVLAGVSEEKMIECHGHFRTASCTQCSRSFDSHECQRIVIHEKRPPLCQVCGGYVKPDIVFFGEDLPSKYYRMVKQDTKRADLLIVMGTSLMVGPVNMIPEMVNRSCPRVLLNRELAGTFLRRNGGPNTRRRNYNTSVVQRDIFYEGDCDAGVRILCRLLGWENELLELNLSTTLVLNNNSKSEDPAA